MAVSRLSQHSIQNAFPKGNTVWDGTTATSAFDSLGAVLVSTATSTITFSSIPQTYQHLQIRWVAQTNRATYGFDDLRVTFNSDSSALYTTHLVFGNGTTVSTGEDTNASFTNIINSAGTTTSGSWWGTAIVDVLDYANTSKLKTMRYINGVDLNGNNITLPGRVNFGSGLYRSLNAVSTITIVSGASATFQPNTQFSLYGIK
jgi:hypothetical protein